jgi:predicted acyl esterase
MPPAMFAVQPPETDPARQRHRVPMTYDYGKTSLFLEAWLPAPLEGREPPSTMPTVLSLQPYTDLGEPSGDHIEAIKTLVSRGYAYVQAHMRGSHESGGCWDFHGRADRSDVADVIAFLENAPWSNGDVGLFGISNPAGSAVLAGGLADKTKTRALKAIVIGAPVTSAYETFAQGGVPRLMPSVFESMLGLALWSQNGQISTLNNRPGERQTCWPEHGLGTTPASEGSMTGWSAEREVRAGASAITAPILVTNGFADRSLRTSYQVGFFDQIPPTTRKAAVYGLFGHEWPDGDDWTELRSGRSDAADQKVETDPAFTRSDWQAMLLAWFDQYLKGLDAGADEWPVVQVQDTDGQWRAEDSWPAPGQRRGALALGPEGVLGATSPEGSSEYHELSYRNARLFAPDRYPPGASAQFVMELDGRLEMAGQPVLDLWVELDRPDAHIAVTLEAYDADGDLIPYAATSGFRSAQHLDPYVGNRFVQATPRLAPVNEPVLVSVPLHPRDIVVPAGGRLVLTVAGSAPMMTGLEAFTGQEDGFYEPSQLSGSATRVKVLHDCGRRHASLGPLISVLRFDLPADERRLLDVREDSEAAERLRRRPIPDETSDAGGTALEPVCRGA